MSNVSTKSITEHGRKIHMLTQIEYRVIKSDMMMVENNTDIFIFRLHNLD